MNRFSVVHCGGRLDFSVRSLCFLCLGGDEVSFDLPRSHREHGDPTAGLRPHQIIILTVTPQIQNQDRSDCTLGSGRLIPIKRSSLWRAVAALLVL